MITNLTLPDIEGVNSKWSRSAVARAQARPLLEAMAADGELDLGAVHRCVMSQWPSAGVRLRRTVRSIITEEAKKLDMGGCSAEYLDLLRRLRLKRVGRGSGVLYLLTVDGAEVVLTPKQLTNPSTFRSMVLAEANHLLGKPPSEAAWRKLIEGTLAGAVDEDFLRTPYVRNVASLVLGDIQKWSVGSFRAGLPVLRRNGKTGELIVCISAAPFYERASSEFNHPPQVVRSALTHLRADPYRFREKGWKEKARAYKWDVDVLARLCSQLGMSVPATLLR